MIAVDRARLLTRPDLDALLAVSSCEALHPLDRIAVLNRWPTADQLLGATHLDVEQAIGRLLRKTKWDPDRFLGRAETTLVWAKRQGIRVISLGDESYPALLTHIYDPPVALFVRGDAAALSARPTVGIVGTRQPGNAGIKAADRLGREAASLGVSVVSGLARGIDSAVHRGTLRGGGVGVAVLGSGIDDVTPRANRGLAAALLDTGGAVVSEYPPGVPALRHHFPARNRILTGLCSTLIVVEAPDRSGALISADYALDQGRDVFVHEAGLNAGGTRGLAAQGAPVISALRDIEDFDFTGVQGAAGTRDKVQDRGKHGGVETATEDRLEYLFGPAPTVDDSTTSNWIGSAGSTGERAGSHAHLQQGETSGR